MTPEEAREAIAGERRVSVFFTDQVPAVRMRRVASDGKPPAFSLLPSEPGKTWGLVGEPEHLKRGRYDVPMFEGRQQALVVLALSGLAGVDPPRGLGIQQGIVIERDGVRYLLLEKPAGFLAKPIPAHTFPSSATIDLVRERLEPPPKFARQETRILEVLAAMGDDPKTLPSRRGSDGPKGRAWDKVRSERRLFPSRKSFDSAWERLRKSGDINSLQKSR